MDRRKTEVIEKSRRDASELYENAICTAQHAENAAGITMRWEPESDQYQEMVKLISSTEFDRLVAKLEAACVAHLIEMDKLGLARTCASHIQFFLLDADVTCRLS